MKQAQAAVIVSREVHCALSKEKSETLGVADLGWTSGSGDNLFLRRGSGKPELSSSIGVTYIWCPNRCRLIKNRSHD